MFEAAGGPKFGRRRWATGNGRSKTYVVLAIARRHVRAKRSETSAAQPVPCPHPLLCPDAPWLARRFDQGQRRHVRGYGRFETFTFEQAAIATRAPGLHARPLLLALHCGIPPPVDAIDLDLVGHPRIGPGAQPVPLPFAPPLD